MLTSDFVTAVRRQGAIPSSFASTDVLAIADGEIQAVFIPLLEQLRQNYFVRELTATVDARGRIALPPRAIGAALRSVQLQVNGSSWVSLPNRAMEDDDSQSTGLPGGYYVDAGSIVLLPTGTAGTLRIRYAARPGRMVLDTNAASAKRISAVTAGATTTAVTCAFTGEPAYSEIIAYGPAHQNKAIAADPTGTQPNFTYLNSALIEQPVVGDYMSIYDSSPFVPLPEELSAALVHRTAGIILRSLAYDEEASMQLKVADEAISRVTPMLSPRNEGNPQRIRGGLRRALSGRGRWG